MSIDWVRWDSDPYWLSSSFWDVRPPWIRPTRPGSIRWQLQRTVAPSTEPITRTEAKLHLRIDTTDEDTYVDNLIQAAREYVELKTGLALMPQTWQLVLDRWPRMDRLEQWPWMGTPMGAMLLPRWPVSSVTSVTYVDYLGATITVASTDYVTDLVSQPPRITPAYNKNWPSSSLAVQNGVRVLFVAGYANAAAVPMNYKQALLLMVGHWYENREAVVVDSRAAEVEVPQAALTLLGIATPPLVG